MKLLAIETSGEACSVAVRLGEDIVEQHRVEPREHTRILLPMIRHLLAEQGLDVQNLDAVVLGNGPGSFIGLRISASVAQGLCFGAGLPLVPVSSLAAVAAEVFGTQSADKVAVAQDARMHEVYMGRFLADAQGLPVPQEAESIVSVERPDLLQGTGWVAAGAGWLRYPQLAAGCAAAVARTSEVRHPRARYLLELGACALRDGNAIPAETLQPAYLRGKVAEPQPRPGR